MSTFFIYLFSLIVILISVFITLYFKSELENMFQEKKEVVAFHICNVLIILMTSFAAQAALGNELNLMLQFTILLLMILPIYIFGYFAYEKYKLINRKYVKAGNGKVLIINEKYLNRK